MTTAQTAVSQVEDLVRDRLAAHKSLFLATGSSSGPWVNGVYFVESGPFSLSLVLEQRGRTLAAIRENPVVALVVSTGSPADPFLQAQATVRIVDGAEDAEVRQALVAKVPEAAPFLGAPIVAVRLEVSAWRVTDIPNGWFPGRELTNPELTF